ncbi:hypothetical protein F2Q69_00060381 [Brassica cretica]|uniref:Uncharacterized protein n=1 Tax=Brassica cretica TaxID=69181 RepID=A0A8S9RFI1_BRACR|nr:hypothetical protein F2Q69_00060381 [Brassica cretica]
MTSLWDMGEESGNDALLFDDRGGDDSDSQWGDDPNYDIRLCGRIGRYNLQKLNKVVVETFEDEPRDKLKANNAIFYLSYKCCADPSSTRLAGDHIAIVRKTMDGKPCHMSHEVALTKEQENE